MSGDSTSFNALIRSSTLSRKLLTGPLAKWPGLCAAVELAADSIEIPRSSGLAASGAAADAHQKRDQSADQKKDEQYFRYPGGAGGNSTEAEYGSYQGNDEEDDGIMKHDRTSCGRAAYSANVWSMRE